jgi:hypothetical protein
MIPPARAVNSRSQSQAGAPSSSAPSKIRRTRWLSRHPNDVGTADESNSTIATRFVFRDSLASRLFPVFFAMLRRKPAAADITKYSRRIHYQSRRRWVRRRNRSRKHLTVDAFHSSRFRKIRFRRATSQACGGTSRNTHAEFIANVISLSALRRINHFMDAGNDAGSVRRGK